MRRSQLVPLTVGSAGSDTSAGEGDTLRVALIGHSRFGIAEPFAGGLEAHTTLTARALVRAGHDVTVFAGPATASSPVDLTVIPIVEREPQYPRHVRRDLSVPAGHHGVIDAAYQSVLDVIASNQFDVVHNNSLHHLPVVRDIPNVPAVHFLHCPPFAELEQAHRERRGLGGSCEHVVSVSNSLAREWQPFSATTIHNGVDTSRWIPRHSTRTERCVWAGRLVPEKAPHLAIDAARRAGRPIVLAGPVLDQPYFLGQIEPRLGSDARWVGHCSSRELRDLYDSSAVGLITPQWDEPFCLVAAEMLATGLPVAAFDRGGLAEFLDDSVAALCASGDIDDLAITVNRVANLDRARCREFAVAHLSIETTVARYVEVYRNAIARSDDLAGVGSTGFAP